MAKPRRKHKARTNVVELAPLALKRRQPELAALTAADLRQVNVDVPQFVHQLTSAAERLQPLLPTLARLPHVPDEPLRRLKDYAIILSHAHQRCQPPPAPKPRTDVVAKDRKLRLMLLADVNALTRRRVLDASILRSLSGARSHRDLAHDLSRLADHLRPALPRIARKSAVTAEDLEHASHLAAALVKGPSVPDTDASDHAAARDLRARAFTLAKRLHADLTRAVRYLQPNEADVLIPSPYAPRHRVPGAELRSPFE